MLCGCIQPIDPARIINANKAKDKPIRNERDLTVRLDSLPVSFMR